MDSRLIFLHRRGDVTSDGGRRRLSTARDWKCGSKRVGGSDRQIRRGVNLKRDGEAFGPQTG